MKSCYILFIIIVLCLLPGCTTNWIGMFSAAGYDNQARFYYSRGNYDNAERLLLKVLEIRKKLQPKGNHPDYIYTLNDLAHFYFTLGNYGNAEPLLLRILEIEIKLQPEGKRHGYPVTLNRLALVYETMGNYDKAEPLYIQAMEIRKSLPPEGIHPDCAKLWENTAKLNLYIC